MKNIYFSVIGAFLLALFILMPATQSWGEPSGIGLKATRHDTNSLRGFWGVNVDDGTTLGAMLHARTRLGETLYGSGYAQHQPYRNQYREYSHAYRYGYLVPHGKHHGLSPRYRHHDTYRYFYRGRHNPYSGCNYGRGSINRGYGYIR